MYKDFIAHTHYYIAGETGVQFPWCSQAYRQKGNLKTNK